MTLRGGWLWWNAPRITSRQVLIQQSLQPFQTMTAVAHWRHRRRSIWTSTKQCVQQQRWWIWARVVADLSMSWRMAVCLVSGLPPTYTCLPPTNFCLEGSCFGQWASLFRPQMHAKSGYARSIWSGWTWRTSTSVRWPATECSCRASPWLYWPCCCSFSPGMDPRERTSAQNFNRDEKYVGWKICWSHPLEKSVDRRGSVKLRSSVGPTHHQNISVGSSEHQCRA